MGELLDDQEVAVTGRVYARRIQGKIVFYDLFQVCVCVCRSLLCARDVDARRPWRNKRQDGDHKVQIMARPNEAKYDFVCACRPSSARHCLLASYGGAVADAAVNNLIRLGDVIGVRGTPGRSKTGELSIFPVDVCVTRGVASRCASRSLLHASCAQLVLLAPCLRVFPAKTGFKDMELRYRMRYMDLLINTANREIFKKRAKVSDGPHGVVTHYTRNTRLFGWSGPFWTNAIS